MNTWYAYRTAWTARPWLLPLAVLGTAMVVLGVVGTITTTGFALLFIPGLLVVLGHHLLVGRQR